MTTGIDSTGTVCSQCQETLPLPTNSVDRTNLMAGSVECIVAKVEKDCSRHPGQWGVPSKIHLKMSTMVIMILLNFIMIIIQQVPLLPCLLNWSKTIIIATSFKRLTWHSNHLVVLVDGVIDVDHHELAWQPRQGHQQAKGDAVDIIDLTILNVQSNMLPGQTVSQILLPLPMIMIRNWALFAGLVSSSSSASRPSEVC